jgi:hypothetical protein
MYLSELSDVSNLLSLEAAKVGGDAAVLQVNNSSEWLVEKRPNGSDREVAGFAARVWIMALKPMSIFPDPMISVTSA